MHELVHTKLRLKEQFENIGLPRRRTMTAKSVEIHTLSIFTPST